MGEKRQLPYSLSEYPVEIDVEALVNELYRFGGYGMEQLRSAIDTCKSYDAVLSLKSAVEFPRPFHWGITVESVNRRVDELREQGDE